MSTAQKQTFHSVRRDFTYLIIRFEYAYCRLFVRYLNVDIVYLRRASGRNVVICQNAGGVEIHVLIDPVFKKELDVAQLVESVDLDSTPFVSY